EKAAKTKDLAEVTRLVAASRACAAGVEAHRPRHGYEGVRQDLAGLHPGPEREFEKARAPDRAVVVRLDLADAGRLVELLRLAHLGQGAETHPLVPLLPRRLDHGHGQRAPDGPATLFRPDVQTLHLAHPVAERPHRHAADHLASQPRHEQPPARPRVLAGQAGHLMGEALVGEVDAERSLVLEEQLARVLRVALGDAQFRYSSASGSGSGAVGSPSSRARVLAENNGPRAGSTSANAEKPSGFGIGS